MKKALQCSNKSSGCPGASPGTSYAGNCYPHWVWSGTLLSTNNYDKGWLNNGTFTPTGGSTIYTGAASVRCVLDLKVYLAADNCYPYHVWTGTQGSGSSYVSPYLGSGSINTANCTGGACSYTYAFTVRCVPDLKFLRAKEILEVRTVKKIAAH